MGLTDSVRRDFEIIHRKWMAAAFPSQRAENASVLGRTTPDSLVGRVAFKAWSAIGLLFLVLLYPVALFGVALKLFTDRVDETATRLGFFGVGGATVLVWGAFTALASTTVDLSGVVAIGVAGLVAGLSAVSAVGVRRLESRPLTVLLAYPLGVTVFFLPPVVASFYSPVIANVVFPRTTELSIWILDTLLWVGGLNSVIRSAFQLEGLAYLVLWVCLSFVLGWFVGLSVSLGGAIQD